MTGGGDYNILLVVGTKSSRWSDKATLSAAVNIAVQLNLPEEKLLGDWIVCIPGFTLEKYRQLQRSRLSIFSINCFGGNILNRLGLPFLTPFINLYLSNKGFIKFLRDPHGYLEKDLIYKGKKSNSKKSYKFPFGKLGDISVNMMHYKTFEDSVDAWERRKAQINWDNIFVVMWSKSLEEVEQFDALPYEKKVCFVPFKSELDSAWYINKDVDKRVSRFVDVFINFAKGKFYYYDWFDMLLYGKKTPLIDM